MKLLKDILYKVNIVSVIGSTDLNFNKIEFNSRSISKNDLFIAIKGNDLDGNFYIPQAIDNGAKIILCESSPKIIVKGISYVIIKDSRQSLAIISSNFYNNPSSKLKLIGITGTNGKTTTSTLMHQLFMLLNNKVGLISTNKILINKKVLQSTHTTPDPLNLNRILSMMVEEGVEYCFMEVSSHAIDQHRIYGLNFDIGLFTNLSHDHLDYHKSFKEYRDVKKAFINSLSKNSFAIINADDKNGAYMTQNTKAKVYKYALKSSSDFSLKILEKDFNGMKLLINGHEVWSKLIGEFNAYNILATYSLAKIFEYSDELILNKISSLISADGRFERILQNNNKNIGIIDYAHSPDSVQKILETLNELKNKEESLITVIGCGGDRDKAKRPLMGKIAASLSNKVIFTSDNPRFEDPKLIIDQMESGVEQKDVYKISKIIDRKEAIEFACQIAKDDDVILVAGKGHEKYQIKGSVKFEFDDKKILTKSLKTNN
ncbi:MAG: UDP-N-acetylmuramoyl-L-alanyl-D-glutamate--2,6-diaminopimelate ligase [Flavobacteriaceae bacterium]|jgi:UDP-N-acetylmuramoyl-L-alanyl-D-glutamate--2,6-diaminopimelate ligase|nr:UDP-N-acetylmuramoyl-L-alanyl-D-glutamate--2,6-diaminopimelate ligase [Flavobacteriaceae bacterium]MBT4416190.1 UDP-N-acetylmuramoyl-L-alanyl-D-glutamate--2,6-diaminopimelate ligase [Flavobacteriaceae bacterium]MBT5011553.1 UDP-N-acetylmuramoyl-L-alanyl-D-glutamate--2,6-diaminopimelate ligase [Flavobacteriaceae bacterium]MBT5396275.1 UDP-N-acetylmuramoyl-L-alanyl-D-glutamate--2,6-diaminopimelate ligase [Flavobacteriaceae bacterium]MBT7320617.1 UDP-N-acetylmuramoyl-L-alanyl-D-glutamate--2,6-d